MARKTAQELMSEIRQLESLLDSMASFFGALLANLHGISGCTGTWSVKFNECEYDYDDEDECALANSAYLEKKYWQLEDFYDKKKDKIKERIQNLHQKRNALAKSVCRSPDLGKPASIKSTFGEIKKA